VAERNPEADRTSKVENTAVVHIAAVHIAAVRTVATVLLMTLADCIQYHRVAAAMALLSVVG
jgi:hypothetical protein